jgi:hypothetical protein
MGDRSADRRWLEDERLMEVRERQPSENGDPLLALVEEGVRDGEANVDQGATLRENGNGQPEFPDTYTQVDLPLGL